MAASQTIVRKVRGGSDPAAHRFVIIYETEAPRSGFMFKPAGAEMTMAEVCAALMAHGISETDALALLTEAGASFEGP